MVNPSDRGRLTQIQDRMVRTWLIDEERRRAYRQRRHLGFQQALQIGTDVLWESPWFKVLVEQAARSRGIDADEAYKILRDDNLKCLPTVRARVGIKAGRDVKFERPTGRGDVWDSGHLATALPYARVILTEKHFADIARPLKDWFQCKVVTMPQDVLTSLTTLPANSGTDLYAGLVD